ncbi:GIY-YIG nuclease family protein [Sphingomonas montanisoli]|uniref:GIY-YIG nuclease family protein n=1 Tax=Sphingomonas montanisoli TaxID=2606412 RepID=A0A5D9C378_9SPHN|nr:GIY-YIG nuclease family protein [Sphingomonas montanisoli]TZG25986.1 GIY-YIG nuclease family protein [Sphingomonas montanisoli]
MAFWAYILRCVDGLYYTGHTDDLDRRIGEHMHGGYCEFTSRRRPVKLMWAQDFPSRYEALDSELRIKGWSRAKKEALFAGDWQRVSFFARPPRERVSTSLDTNGVEESRRNPTPFVSSEVETPLGE